MVTRTAGVSLDLELLENIWVGTKKSSALEPRPPDTCTRALRSPYFLSVKLKRKLFLS